MALSIKTEEADRLARELSRLTGESMTEAVTKSLRERLEREKKTRPKRPTKKERAEEIRRIKAWLARTRKNYDLSRPLPTKADYDEMWGEDDVVKAIRK